MRKKEYIEKLIDRLIEEENLSVNKLAEELNMTLNELNKLCLEIFDKHPKDLIMEKMILYCLVQFSHNGKEVCEIARKLGYGYVKSFRRAFERVMGISPEEAKKIIQENSGNGSGLEKMLTKLLFRTGKDKKR